MTFGRTNMIIIVILTIFAKQVIVIGQQNFVSYKDCNECISNGGRQCLLKEEWTYSVCCHPDPNKSSDFCKDQ